MFPHYCNKSKHQERMSVRRGAAWARDFRGCVRNTARGAAYAANQVGQASMAAEKVDSGKILVAQAPCLCAFLNFKRIHRVIDRKNRTGRVPVLLFPQAEARATKSLHTPQM